MGGSLSAPRYRRQELKDTGRRDDDVLMFAPCCSRVALDYSRRIG